MTGIYSINSPKMLFSKLVREFAAFDKSPTEDGIFSVLFPLYHLREWICPGGHLSYKGKPETQLSKEEWLHSSLYNLAEYKLVGELCNNAKHFSVSNLAERTQILKGFRAGLGRCTDSLSVTHFLIDGIEIRPVFWKVYKIYFKYFEATDPKFLTELTDSIKEQRNV